MSAFFGRLLLVAGLGFEAYNLFTHSDTISKFNLNYSRGLAKLPLNESITSHLYNQETIARYVVFALYVVSALLLFVRSKFITFLVLVGVALNTFFLANPYLDKSQNSHFLLLQNLAIVGGLFYLLGQEKPVCPVQKVIGKVAQVSEDAKSSTTNSTNNSNKNKKKNK